MKKVFIIFLVIVCLAGAALYIKKEKTAPKVPSTTTTYRSTETGIAFTYPKILTASTTDGVIELHHDIPYANSGACDMTGDLRSYDKLTDFDMTVQVSSQSLVKTVKTMSPYIPQENFVNDTLVPSPGFIDPYRTSSLSGFAIYEGAEGCGHTIYYFPLSDSKTLVITKEMIQALNPSVRSQESIAAILSVPSAISPAQSEQIFDSIVTSLSDNY